MTERLSAGLKLALGVMSGSFLIFLMAVTVVDVVGRYILNAPLLGAYELSEVSIGIVVAAALPLVTLSDGHIRLNLLDRFLGRAGVWIRDLVSALMFAVGSGILAWRMVAEYEIAVQLGKATELLGIPRAPILGFVAVTFALAAAIGLMRALAAFTGPSSDRSTGGSAKSVSHD